MPGPKRIRAARSATAFRGDIPSDQAAFPEPPNCCGLQLTLWGDTNCCCMIPIATKIDVNETRTASVNFNASVTANAVATDDASALATQSPAAAASSTPQSDSDGKLDSKSDSSQTTTTMQGQAQALICTEFVFRWRLNGYCHKAHGKLIVSGAVNGVFQDLGPEGEITLSRLLMLDTTAPVAAQQANAVMLFTDARGDQASARITLTRAGT